ncbi:rhomboid family intramembrane serine protease [Rhabdochlamydiaceae symbiont of Dictyostelium giganteum]|uniref:rhomboid family intramembrane serine protease n=1 Tax=Rhabdochlamydiaceae symbiont of Dictyostelium giganteum TaxID=3342349 RepID=UPI00385178E3
MRLLGEFQQEKEALHFQLFLQKEQIESVIDSDGVSNTRLWVIEEESFVKALSYYERWLAGDLTFTVTLKKRASSPRKNSKGAFKAQLQEENTRFKNPGNQIGALSFFSLNQFSLTKFFIALCVALFVITTFQMRVVEKDIGPIGSKYPFLPVHKKLLFDYPKYLENLESFFKKYEIRESTDLNHLSHKEKTELHRIEEQPTWQGILSFLPEGSIKDVLQFPRSALMTQIQEGELWRLITPVFLHGSFLHIFFNMTWLFMLGTQIEIRIGAAKYLFLSFLLAVFSNIAQYGVSGPIFIGYSGIITGIFGFIWSRQKIAPKEGYPLQKRVIKVMAGFVMVMFALEVIALLLQLVLADPIDISIANTAHMTGGLFGIVLGRCSFFAKKTA